MSILLSLLSICFLSILLFLLSLLKCLPCFISNRICYLLKKDLLERRSKDKYDVINNSWYDNTIDWIQHAMDFFFVGWAIFLIKKNIWSWTFIFERLWQQCNKSDHKVRNYTSTAMARGWNFTPKQTLGCQVQSRLSDSIWWVFCNMCRHQLTHDKKKYWNRAMMIMPWVQSPNKKIIIYMKRKEHHQTPSWFDHVSKSQTTSLIMGSL